MRDNSESLTILRVHTQTLRPHGRKPGALFPPLPGWTNFCHPGLDWVEVGERLPFTEVTVRHDGSFPTADASFVPLPSLECPVKLLGDGRQIISFLYFKVLWSVQPFLDALEKHEILLDFISYACKKAHPPGHSLECQGENTLDPDPHTLSRRESSLLPLSWKSHLLTS